MWVRQKDIKYMKKYDTIEHLLVLELNSDSCLELLYCSKQLWGIWMLKGENTQLRWSHPKQFNAICRMFWGCRPMYYMYKNLYIKIWTFWRLLSWAFKKTCGENVNKSLKSSLVSIRYQRKFLKLIRAANRHWYKLTKKI